MSSSSSLLRQAAPIMLQATTSPAAHGLLRLACVALYQRIPMAHGYRQFSAQAEQQQQQPKEGSSEGPSASASAGDASTSGADASTSTSTSSSSSSAGSSAAGPSFDAFASSFKSNLGSFASRLGATSGSGSSSGADGSSSGNGNDAPREALTARAARLWSAALREVGDAVLPRDDAVSLTKAYTGPVYDPGTAPSGGPTALATIKRDPTQFEKLWGEWQARYGHHPLFRRLAALRPGEALAKSAAVQKGQALVDDLRERYETSDSPMVHKVDDLKERVFGATDAASAMATILQRDPRFDMGRLLAGVKKDAPRVVSAFLTHDLAALQEHCGPELMERFAGIFRHFEAEGLKEDPTILFVGDAELVELKAVDGEPLVVVQFNCQQIKCTRDKFGNVVDGAADAIQRVYYFWGLQQEAAGAVLPDGRVLPPRWVIKDMMWQSMLALV